MRSSDNAARALPAFAKAGELAAETVPQPMAGDLALTLLFWLMVSSRWQDDVERIERQPFGKESMQQPHSADEQFWLTESGTYLCGAERLADSGDAIRCVMETFCQTQPEPRRAACSIAPGPVCHRQSILP